MVTDVNGNGSPNWGDTVTFDVSTTATTEPYVDLVCSQNGVVVYGATAGFFASYPVAVDPGHAARVADVDRRRGCTAPPRCTCSTAGGRSRP